MTYISEKPAYQPRRTDEGILKRIEEVRAQRYAHLTPQGSSVAKVGESNFVVEKRDAIQELADELREDKGKDIDFSDLLKSVSTAGDEDVDADPEIAELLKNLHKK